MATVVRTTITQARPRRRGEYTIGDIAREMGVPGIVLRAYVRDNPRLHPGRQTWTAWQARRLTKAYTQARAVRV